MSKRRSLADKLEDNQYLEKLSDRRIGQLMVCKKVMTQEELDHYNSIDVAYSRIARERYIKQKYGDEFYQQVADGAIPFFLRYSDEESL